MRNALLLVSTLLGAAPCLGADTYPNKPVRLIVASLAGTNQDFNARMIGQQLSEQLGKQFVVDNRAGAGGIIGHDSVAKAVPDGYTLGIVDAGFVIQPSMTKSLPYESNKDFTYITQLIRFTIALAVTPSLNVNTLQEFIALARANPGKLNYGSSGRGSATHLFSELFKIAAKVDIVHIPFKGGSDVVTAMLGGQVQMQITGLPAVLPNIRSGKMRALAVTTDGKRSPALPDVPSMSEAGLPGMVIYGWQGLRGPAGLPKNIVNKLHTEVIRALAVPSVKERLIAQEGEAVGSSPQEFSKLISSELQRWAMVVKSAGITPE